MAENISGHSTRLLLFIKRNPSLALFFLLVATIGFSYQPLLYFGLAQGTNLKLSIAHIILVAFAISSIPSIIRRREILLHSKITWLFLTFCLISSVAILWSDNTLRGVFVSAFSWALFGMFIAVQAISEDIQKNGKPILRWFYVGVTIAIAFAWWQLAAEAIGISQKYTLLPTPYLSTLFGYARPTSFLLEPQFLGNFLLIPLFLSLDTLVKKNRGIVAPALLFTFSLATIITTLSRGAYMGVAIGLLIFVIVHWRKYWRRLCLISILSALIATSSFGLLGLAAQANTRDNIDGQEAIYKSINHASLGTITLPHTQKNDEQSTPADSTEAVQTTQRGTDTHSGYVQESTDSRLTMSQEALNLWRESPLSILFGIGMGSFGATLHDKNPTHSISSIVNNQFIKILTELGLVGFAVFILLLFTPLWHAYRKRYWILIVVSISLYTQWLFFSGSFNVPHLWLFIAITTMVATTNLKPIKT